MSNATYMITKNTFDLVMTLFFRNTGLLSSTDAMTIEDFVMDDDTVEITAEVTGESIQ